MQTQNEAVVFVPTREDIVDYIWDVYKEVNNIRPRWVNFDAMSYEELDTWAKQLAAQAVEACRIAEIEKAEALAEFEESVLRVIDAGAGDRATALRWMADAANAQCYLSVESMLYDAGILFSKDGNALRDEILAAIG